MPNHVRNVLTFKRLKTKDKQFILDNFTKEMEDDIYPLNRVFDFDKIIPEPRSESECPKDCLVNKDSHVKMYDDRPWFDWYTWHNKYWDTKWNAYDSYVKIGRSTITFVFSTAWNAPYKVYEQLHKKYPELNWEVRYADEDWGSNCGKLIYDPDKTGFKDVVHISEDDLSDPDNFARRLWDTY